MEENQVTISLWDGEIHLTVSVDKEVYKKMKELTRQNPSKWVDRGLDLVKEAENLL